MNHFIAKAVMRIDSSIYVPKPKCDLSTHICRTASNNNLHCDPVTNESNLQREFVHTRSTETVRVWVCKQNHSSLNHYLCFSFNFIPLFHCSATRERKTHARNHVPLEATEEFHPCSHHCTAQRWTRNSITIFKHFSPPWIYTNT